MYSSFTLIQIIISRLCIGTCRMDNDTIIYIKYYKQLVIDFDIFFFFYCFVCMNCDYIVLWFRYFSKTLFLKILFEAYMNWSSWMYWYKVQWLKALKWIFNYKFVDLSINESHRHWHSINVDETTVW